MGSQFWKGWLCRIGWLGTTWPAKEIDSGAMGENEPGSLQTSPWIRLQAKPFWRKTPLPSSSGMDLGTRQCQRVFQALGFRLRKPRPLTAKTDPEEQAVLKKTARTDKRSQNWLMESGRMPLPTTWSQIRMWVPPENIDPIQILAPTSKSIALFGAVNIRLITLVQNRFFFGQHFDNKIATVYSDSKCGSANTLI